MSETPDAWKRLDIALKAIIAVAGIWVSVLYHGAQMKADAEQHRLDELRVIKEFFDPLTSSDKQKRIMAAAVIGQLASEKLVFRLATALPLEQAGAMLAVYGPKTAKNIVSDTSQPLDVHDNAAAALDTLFAQSRGQVIEDAPIPAAHAPWDAGSAGPSLSPASKLRSTEGFVYLGQWDHESGTSGAWVTHYFERHDGTPPPLGELKGAQLRVSSGAVYLRSDVPDVNGNNRSSKGVLHKGEEVTVENAPLWNFGVNDSGFLWAKVKTTKK